MIVGSLSLSLSFMKCVRLDIAKLVMCYDRPFLMHLTRVCACDVNYYSVCVLCVHVHVMVCVCVVVVAPSCVA